jgi:hypothetical protein
MTKQRLSGQLVYIYMYVYICKLVQVFSHSEQEGSRRVNARNSAILSIMVEVIATSGNRCRVSIRLNVGTLPTTVKLK